MPLDPLVKDFLDRVAALPRPAPGDLPIAVMRHGFAAMMGMMGARDVPAGKVENFTIPGPAGPIRARAYAPVAAGSEPRPALIYFHGGAFVTGDLDTHDGLCRLLAVEGSLKVIAVDYRLAPENKWPAPLEDGLAAVEHIAAGASSLGIDAGRIAVGGDSAGGHLAAVLTQALKEKGGPKLAFQLLMFPGTEFTTDTASMQKYGAGYFLERRTVEWAYAQVLPESADRNSPAISPLRATDFRGLPPAHIVLAGYDPLHDEGLAYAERLRAAGVKVTVADYPDMVHCFVYLQNLLPQARQAIADAAKAVAQALAES